MDIIIVDYIVRLFVIYDVLECDFSGSVIIEEFSDDDVKIVVLVY